MMSLCIYYNYVLIAHNLLLHMHVAIAINSWLAISILLMNQDVCISSFVYQNVFYSACVCF